MTKFDAVAAVEAMEIDFTAFGGPAVQIPEPSNAQVETFIRFVATSANRVRDMATEAQKKELEGLSDDEVMATATAEGKVIEQELYQSLVDVCSGVITIEEIKALPYRVQNAFAAWLARELNPESHGVATKR